MKHHGAFSVGRKETNHEKKRTQKTIGSHALGNRTVIGIICIVAALAICFGIAPVVNKSRDGKTAVVRAVRTVEKGSPITDAGIEIAEVGSYNLTDGLLKNKHDVIGEHAACNLFPGDYILPAKLTDKTESAGNLLKSLQEGKKAISVTIGSFAMGLSGKLESGGIVSAVIYDSTENRSFTPPELRYVKVITSTTSQGIDKAEVADSAHPVTVTLLVNDAQAELLALYERTGNIHFVLEFRGDASTAQKGNRAVLCRTQPIGKADQRAGLRLQAGRQGGHQAVPLPLLRSCGGRHPR